MIKIILIIIFCITVSDARLVKFTSPDSTDKTSLLVQFAKTTGTHVPDISESTVSGTLNAGFWGDDEWGKYLDLNGTAGQYVTMGTSPDPWSFSTGELFISFWWARQGGGDNAGKEIILSNRPASLTENQFQHAYEPLSGQHAFAIRSSGAFLTNRITFNVNSDAGWHFYCITRKNGTLNIYVDSVSISLDQSGISNEIIGIPNSDMVFGARHFDKVRRMNAYIKFLTFRKKVPSQAEINEMYESQKGIY